MRAVSAAFPKGEKCLSVLQEISFPQARENHHSKKGVQILSERHWHVVVPKTNFFSGENPLRVNNLRRPCCERCEMEIGERNLIAFIGREILISDV